MKPLVAVGSHTGLEENHATARPAPEAKVCRRFDKSIQVNLVEVFPGNVVPEPSEVCAQLAFTRSHLHSC